jgi:multimeric flavodoxin WrbA
LRQDDNQVLNILLLSDRDYRTELSEDLRIQIIEILKENGHTIETFEIGKCDVTQCIGCLLCLTEHPGECVNKDIVNEIRKSVEKNKYSATFFLTPVIFGHYSSTMASPINKGTGCHNLQVIIGYGDDIDKEEKSTFIDLTAKHRGSMDIIHPGMDRQVDVYVSSSAEDTSEICKVLKQYSG